MVVSLPSDIVKKYGLKKGQELEVTEEKGKISVFIESQLQKQPCEITAKDAMIEEQLEVLYTKGYDEIKVYYENKEILKKIVQNTNRRFIGLQVLDSNGKYCVIKSVAQEDDTKLPNLIRRSFLILLSLLETEDEDNKENLTKLINICKRILHQKNYELNEAMHYYNLITIIEEISQTEYKNKKQAKEIIEQIYNLYYKFDEQESAKIKNMIGKEFITSKKDSNKALFLYNAEKMLGLIASNNIRIGT